MINFDAWLFSSLIAEMWEKNLINEKILYSHHLGLELVLGFSPVMTTGTTGDNQSIT